MYITTAKALLMGIEALKHLPDTNENNEAISRLKALINTPRLMNWTQESVHETIKEWAAAHGRNPTVSDLAETGMPKNCTIRKLFNMQASTFLRLYYPDSKKKIISKYYNLTKDDMLKIFRNEFIRLNAPTSKTYDKLRDKSTPSWTTVAKVVSDGSWYGLLREAEIEVKYVSKKESYWQETQSIKVQNSEIQMFQKFQELDEIAKHSINKKIPPTGGPPDRQL